MLSKTKQMTSSIQSLTDMLRAARKMHKAYAKYRVINSVKCLSMDEWIAEISVLMHELDKK